MKILHHNDADGRCSAAIVSLELTTFYDMFKKEDFIEYEHGYNITLPDVVENEHVYIVDIALNESTYNFLKYFVDKGCKVVYIDHHITTGNFLMNATEDQRKIINNPNVVMFYKSEIQSGDDDKNITKVSATMLTWIYSCMNENERKNPNLISFDFTETFSHVALNIDQPEMREYNIPIPIRYIDDYDIWRKALKNTDAFHEGYMLMSDEETHPFEPFWKNIIYDTPTLVNDMVGEGYICLKKNNVRNANIIKHAFEYDIEGNKCLCVNAIDVNSTVFGERIHEYPMVCAFHYDGAVGLWMYSFYSSEKNTDSVDCAELATKLGGGGHKLASGCQLPYNYFADDWSRNR